MIYPPVLSEIFLRVFVFSCLLLKKYIIYGLFRWLDGRCRLYAGEESPGTTEERCRLMAGEGDFRESATESKPPDFRSGKGERVR